MEKAVNTLQAKKWLQDLNAFKVFQGKKSSGLKVHEAEVGTIIKSHSYVHVCFPSMFWQRPHTSEHNCLRDVSSMLGFCRQA